MWGIKARFRRVRCRARKGRVVRLSRNSWSCPWLASLRPLKQAGHSTIGYLPQLAPLKSTPRPCNPTPCAPTKSSKVSTCPRSTQKMLMDRKPRCSKYLWKLSIPVHRIGRAVKRSLRCLRLFLSMRNPGAGAKFAERWIWLILRRFWGNRLQGGMSNWTTLQLQIIQGIWKPHLLERRRPQFCLNLT